ncbi:chemotaxis protein CheW [Herbaspirillum sp. SJZ107]|uniref:chemotaxis protein CheW n=1 Tax=Herbaspirillum sp. SJZ107 TaxID=2572881 RepID=UPI0011532464|nr:chemotaxis protein CheW [Herbaspirillum sp. SJZ107]TQK10627.1 chemotaxis signal transduction protein [Herbaspirillum sp. SJZ107]
MSALKPGSGTIRNSLSRPVDADYGEDWARELARPASGAGSTDAAAMVFRVGAEWLAVPLALAASVAPVAPVHRLPHRGGGGPLLGIVAAGGRLLPAVSLARLLEIDAGAAVPAGRHAFARLLVLAESGPQRGTGRSAGAFALPVDEVQGVVRYAGAALLPPAATVGRAPPPLVSGVLADAVRAAGDNGVAGSGAAGLLDAGRLMTALKGLLR